VLIERRGFRPERRRNVTIASDELFRGLERELFAAHEGSPDLAAIDRLYADDFLSTNADGRVVDKQGWLDILRAGQFPVDKITTDDFKVRTYSSTAIVTGRSAYHYAGQKLWEVRHTQVWANTNGRWQLVSWQGTSVPPET
jgi:hypothetical protein